MAKNTTIHFENASAMCLYFMEMEGQLSDGKYENSRPYDHWKWLCNVKNAVVDGSKGLEEASYTRGYNNYGVYQKKYNLNEWFSKYIKGWRKDGKTEYMWATRIIAFGKFGKIYPELTYEQLMKFNEIRCLLEDLQVWFEEGEKSPEVLFKKMTDFSKYTWREQYYNSCKDYLTLDFVKKFVEMNYDIKECKVDCKSMYDSINTVWNYKYER